MERTETERADIHPSLRFSCLVRAFVLVCMKEHTYLCVLVVLFVRVCAGDLAACLVSAVPIIKKKTVKSEILIIWREHEGKRRGDRGVGEVREAKGGPERGGGVYKKEKI